MSGILKTGRESRFLYHFRTYPPALFFILIIGLLLRLPGMSDSLWYDELWATNVKLGDLRSLAFTAISDAHPPFYTVLMFLWIRIFGDSEISVRMPSLILGAASIFLVFAAAKYFIGNRAALIAALLLSLSPVHIWYSHEARSYSILVFFLLLSIIAHCRLRSADAQPIWFYVYFFSMFICVMTHFYLAAYVFVISLVTIAEKPLLHRRILAANGFIVFCLFALLALKLATGRLQTTVGVLRYFTLTEFYELFFNWFLLGNSFEKESLYPYILVVQIVCAFFLLRGVRRLLKKDECGRSAYEIVIYLFVLPVSILLMSAAGSKNYIERSVFVALRRIVDDFGRGFSPFSDPRTGNARFG